MNDKAFARLEEVVLDPIFPEVDVALRQGRHIDRDEGDSYAFLLDAQDTLEPFYMRYGWDLIHASDGFFYLLPRGDQLGQRHLSVGEMLVGQTLALMYLDPTTLQAGGVVQRPQLVARLAGLIGERELVSALNPRRRKYDERIAQETVRTEVGKALRGLAGLGFVEILGEEQLRLRPPLLRFAEPVRGLEDPQSALARLVAVGKAVMAVAEDAEKDEP